MRGEPLQYGSATASALTGIDTCEKACYDDIENALRRNPMSRNAIIELVAGIILIGLFLIAWLVFKNIKSSDWIALVLGVLDLICFAITVNREKK